MNANNVIIDVKPIEYSSGRNVSGASEQTRAHAERQGVNYRQSGWNATAFSQSVADEFGRVGRGVYARHAGQETAMKSARSVVGGFAQIAIGAGLALIGVPMLILPGPGLLAIGGGMALAANGMRKLLQ